MTCDAFRKHGPGKAWIEDAELRAKMVDHFHSCQYCKEFLTTVVTQERMELSPDELAESIAKGRALRDADQRRRENSA